MYLRTHNSLYWENRHLRRLSEELADTAGQLAMRSAEANADTSRVLTELLAGAGCTSPAEHVRLAHRAEQAERLAEQADARLGEALEEAARLGRDLAEVRRLQAEALSR
jgi:hypothetical protein